MKTYNFQVMFGGEFIDSVFATSAIDACYEIAEEYGLNAEELVAFRA